MKKTLLILCALLLTAVGASAQTYEFKNTDWVGVDGRSTSTESGSVTYADDCTNTITVVAGISAGSYTNNIALENKNDEGYVTASYTVSGWQHWFIVVGTNLSTNNDETNGYDSKLWWMNGANNGGEWTPTKVVELNDDGKVLIAWDLSLMPAIDMKLHNDVNYLDGYICFGLTSSDATTHTSVISDIGFYTLEEAIEEYDLGEGQLTETTTPYKFNASDWVVLSDHTSSASATATGNNTITVTTTANSPTAMGLCNGNDSYNTANYYVGQDQSWFVIVGTNLSTATDASLLWWMNGYNDGSSYAPTETATLGDGQIVLAWDLSQSTAGNYMLGKKNTLNGSTCFGLTSSTGESVISDINFYTETEAYNLLNGTDATHVCEANLNHWTFTLTGEGSLGGYWVDSSGKEDNSGIEPPYVTYWVTEYDGGTLPNTKISHETLTGLEAGVYEVSMDIRIIDYDEGTVGAGTTFNATTGSTTVSQDIKLGVNANETSFTESGEHDDIYGTYTLYVTVAEGGSLTVSLDITNATYNWIMFKNLKVKYLGTDATPVTVSGTMGAEYGTLILPFDATITDGLTAYTAGEVTNDADGDVLTLTKVDDGKLTAGTPYIIGGSSGDSYEFKGVPTKYEVSYTDGTLTGTLVNMTQDDFSNDGSQYVLQNQSSGLGFYPITSESEGVTLSAYHCYLTYSAVNPESAPAKLSISFGGGATAIVAVEGAEAEADGAIYDLSGRRVEKAVKGVYIQNGKKVLVK